MSKKRYKPSKKDVIRAAGLILFVVGCFHIPGVKNYDLGKFGLHANGIQFLGIACVIYSFAVSQFKLSKNDLAHGVGALLFVAGGFNIPGIVNSQYNIATIGLTFTSNSVQLAGIAILVAPFALKYFQAKTGVPRPSDQNDPK